MTDMSDPKTAVVTGAAGGIGYAVAMNLASDGWNVVAVDIDENALQEAYANSKVLAITHDVSKRPEQLAATLTNVAGHISCLVHGAATMQGRSFLELEPDEVSHSWATNVFGPWELSRRVAKHMIETGVHGSIIFISSLHSGRVRMCPDYSTSKAALSMLTKEMASELGRHGIRVNSLSPGAINTWPHDSDAFLDQEQAGAPLTSLRRLGRPMDVAKAVGFLANAELSGYITGADLKVDGGLDLFNWLHHLYSSAADEQLKVSTRTVSEGDT